MKGSKVTERGAKENGQICWKKMKDEWNRLADGYGLIHVKGLSPGRQVALRARLREHPDFWILLEEALLSRGRWARDHQFPTFDQAVRATLFQRLIEGNYRERK